MLPRSRCRLRHQQACSRVHVRAHELLGDASPRFIPQPSMRVTLALSEPQKRFDRPCCYPKVSERESHLDRAFVATSNAMIISSAAARTRIPRRPLPAGCASDSLRCPRLFSRWRIRHQRGSAARAVLCHHRIIVHPEQRNFRCADYPAAR